jgi:metal-sulfur cluster biosynthetic enzyme
MDTRGPTTIWIQPVRAPDAEPRLTGPQDRLDAVMAALRRVQELRETRDIVASGRVQAIEIADDEATLTLRMGQGLCDDAHVMAEMAFEALRSALPDTDLYLRHDRPLGCAGKATGGG